MFIPPITTLLELFILISSFATIECNMPVVDLKHHNSERICLEEVRLESFDAKWPHEEKCSKQNMAQAGLYFVGKPDCVRCFVCHITLSGWDQDSDEPWKKHRELSPHCMFAKLGKEEAELTVEQWLEIMCCRAINKVDCIARDIIGFQA